MCNVGILRPVDPRFSELMMKKRFGVIENKFLQFSEKIVASVFNFVAVFVFERVLYQTVRNGKFRKANPFSILFSRISVIQTQMCLK